MSFFDLRARNRGSYEDPHSGVGIEYAPLGPPLEKDQVLIHEVGYLERNDWWIFPYTISPFWRLYYNAEPGHKVVVGDREIPLDPEHLVVIPAHQMFDSYGLGAVPHFWMAFSLGVFFVREGPQVLRMGVDEARLIGRICDQFTAPGVGDRFTIFHLATALLHQVIARPGMEWDTRPRSSVAVEVADHIHQHFASSLDVPGLAKLVGVSARSLSAMFQREYHVSPTRFIARVRASEAARLLMETNLSLEAIAENTGFPNRFYLTRVFTKFVGKSPARFRRDHRAARE